MTVILAICVGVTFAMSIYLMLGRELKEIAMGTFLITHAGNLSIIAMAGSPMVRAGLLKRAPILSELGLRVDSLPQALILTAIVISFAVSGFLLTLVVLTGRTQQTLNVDELASE